MSDSLVIIPTFNEKENIQDLILEILSLEMDFHILVVDDNSPDGTAQIVKNLQETNGDRLFLLERNEKKGLGTAYLTGFKYALSKHYNYIFEMDADFSHNPKDLISLRNACENDGADLAIGSRYIKGVNVVNWPMGRVLMSYMASAYVRLITGLPIADATAGFKCYKRAVLETIDLDKVKFVGYAFQIEMKFRVWKHGFRLKEIPIIFINRTKGTSKMSTGIFKEAFLGVIQMKFSSLFSNYEKVS
ncbi:MAG: polyprenol monophosphomannose synthase [Bacteroidetes bacterium]|nr:polyprenol monophosphomannose synthase [Bacteroidota bacterium]MDA1121558.1 polyprenol monophosphomannose synthase [Bacteroidota bacterium]